MALREMDTRLLDLRGALSIQLSIKSDIIR